MITPISQAAAPPQPNTPVYGPDDLQLFNTYDRPAYLAAFGTDAPTYDVTKKTKSWFDTDAAGKADANGNVTYKALSVLQPNLSSPAYDTMTMSVAEAMTINLYGIHSYPAYTMAGSGATTGGQPIDPKFLSMQADAMALMQAVGGSNLTFETGSPFFPILYSANETRRVWDFQFKGVTVNAGVLLQEMSANGVGAPGKWDLSGAEPNWISSLPSSLPPANPSWPMPERALLPNEILIATGLPGAWSIQRTDMQNPAAPTSGAGGGLTSAQDQTLTAIANGIKSILAFFRLS